MYALNLGADKRILSATSEKYASKGMVFVDKLPDGDISDYLYINGNYVYEPVPAPPPVPTPEERIEELEAALSALLRGDTLAD